MNFSYFSKKTNLYLLYKNLFEYCKNDLLINKMLNIPNLITNKNKFPLYGFYSTIHDISHKYDSSKQHYLQKIYNNGFIANNSNPITFAIPFKKNYEELLEKSNKDSNITITISNEIIRALTNFDENNKKNNFLEFPIILACFVNDNNIKSKKIKINEWIYAYDKNNIHIIGHFNIKITNDNILKNLINLERSTNINNNRQNREKQIKKYNIMLNLNYSYEFIINNIFFNKYTIPITYIDDIIEQKGGKKNKNVLKNIIH
jgi:hypothetical protein